MTALSGRPNLDAQCRPRASMRRGSVRVTQASLSMAAVLFDLDGTLHDRASGVNAFAAHHAERLGMESRSRSRLLLDPSSPRRHAGPERDPHNPLFRDVGQNYLKGRLRSQSTIKRKDIMQYTSSARRASPYPACVSAR